MKNVAALINIESSLLAQEVMLRSMAHTDSRHAVLLQQNSASVYKNVANAITGIRAEVSGYLYENHTEENNDE